MPELPEVETVTRGLRAALVGRTVVEVDVRREKTLVPPNAEGFVAHLTGRRVTQVRRRGKWILLTLDSGETLIAHLRMTGQLVLSDDRPDDPYIRVLFALDDGRYLRFSDMRKFGRLWLTAHPDEVLGGLGPEPLADDFTAERLADMLRGRRRRIKALLLDQHFLVGLGNIYTDEALHRAGIHPRTRAHCLDAEEAARLLAAIRAVLRAGLAANGASIDWMYRGGAFQNDFRVYHRAGEPCLTCGAPIERIIVGQRSTHFCPHCQRLKTCRGDGKT